MDKYKTYLEDNTYYVPFLLFASTMSGDKEYIPSYGSGFLSTGGGIVGTYKSKPVFLKKQESNIWITH